MGWFGAGRIVAAVEVSGNRQAGLSSGGTDEVENLLIMSSGSPAQFLEISEKRRCSIGFHLEVPVG